MISKPTEKNCKDKKTWWFFVGVLIAKPKHDDENCQTNGKLACKWGVAKVGLDDGEMGGVRYWKREVGGEVLLLQQQWPLILNLHRCFAPQPPRSDDTRWGVRGTDWLIRVPPNLLCIDQVPGFEVGAVGISSTVFSQIQAIINSKSSSISNTY